MEQGTGAAYAGLSIAYLPRNSTPRQDGNYSQRRQRYLIADHIVAGGGTPVPYDEGIASGRDLGKRPAAQLALEHVASGELHGLAWEKLDRTTRDEFGTDAGVIAETLAGARALLVTLRKDYRLWRTDDLAEYRRLTSDAGIEMLTIRDRLWAGVLEKAKDEPFFMGVPPYGYTTVLKEGRGGGSSQRNKITRVPAKDETCAEVMDNLAWELSSCTALGEVCAVLNTKGLFRRFVVGELAGAPSHWRTKDIRGILEKELYGGWWTLGTSSDGASSIWESSPAGANHGGRIPALHVPHLAWFTPEQLAFWRERFPRKADKSGPRHRTNRYPLRGMLACPSCHKQLVGRGDGLYVCSELKSTAMDKFCERPRSISEKGAITALLAELPRALAAVQHHRAELALAAADTDELDAIRRKRDMRKRQMDKLVEHAYPDDWDGTANEAVVRRLQSWQAEVDELQRELGRREAASTVDPNRELLVETVLSDPAAVWQALPQSEQYALLRLVFADVRISATGWGSGRTYKVEHYDNLLLDTGVVSASACASTPYRSILRWMGVRE